MNREGDAVKTSFDEFTADWRADLATVSASLDARTNVFLNSYRRLVSLQAWRDGLLESKMSQESLAFFSEAQNDALVSHVLARCGAWRTALQSLRSCAENVVKCLYYMDHPVELSLWHDHKHRLSFTEHVDYLSSHPFFQGVPQALTGTSILRDEYHVLSAAVHASSTSFRMTSAGQMPSLWSSEHAALGKWGTRERSTLQGLNLVLLTMFRHELQGARLMGVRKAVALAVPLRLLPRIQASLGVRLPRP